MAYQFTAVRPEARLSKHSGQSQVLTITQFPHSPVSSSPGLLKFVPFSHVGSSTPAYRKHCFVSAFSEVQQACITLLWL